VNQYIRIPHHILIVDNASADGTSEMVSKEYPDAILIQNPENLGFSRAMNEGLDYLNQNKLPCDYVVFLNDDAVFRDESLVGLVQHLKKNPYVCAALPAVFSGHDQLQTGAGGYELSLTTAFYYFSGLSILLPFVFKGFFIHQKYFRNKGIVLELDWISGVCLVLKGEAADKLRFPEDYFMYAEDVALCQEIKNFGKIVYFPSAQIFHVREKNHSFVYSSLWLDSLFQYFDLKSGNKKPSRLWFLKIIFMGGFLMRSFGYTVVDFFSQKNYQEKRKELRDYIRHIWKSFSR